MAWDWVLRKLESVCIGRLPLCSDWPLECLQERPKAVSFLLRKKKQAGTSGLLVYHTQAVLMIRAPFIQLSLRCEGIWEVRSVEVSAGAALRTLPKLWLHETDISTLARVSITIPESRPGTGGK